MSIASQCHRKSCSIPCRCRWEGRTAVSRILDLSFDGAILTHQEPIPELGATVVLEFEVGSNTLPFRGEVVYTQPSKWGAFGVHFTDNALDNLGKLLPLYQSGRE